MSGCAAELTIMLILAEALTFAHKRRNYNIRLRLFPFPSSPECQHRLSITCSPFSHKHALEARPGTENRCRQALF